MPADRKAALRARLDGGTGATGGGVAAANGGCDGGGRRDQREAAA
jgi:hypothetical protein